MDKRPSRCRARSRPLDLAALLGFLAATPLLTLEAQRPIEFDPVRIDSGTVVRLHWNDGREKARLLAPLTPASPLVRYCRYPSPVCGGSTLNPALNRSTTDLARVEVRRGSRAGPGALIGAGVGTVGGLLVLLGYSLSDRPALSTGEQVVTVAAIAGVWAGLGALIGAASDNWEEVPAAGRIGRN